MEDVTEVPAEPVPEIVETVVPVAPVAPAAPLVESAAPEAKKRGRPPGARNKPKITEIPAQKEEVTKKVPDKVVDRISEKADEEKPIPPLLTQAQVHQLLRESYRISEMEASEARRRRYAALFERKR